MHNISLLDALLSLADVSSGPGYCRPVIVEPAAAPEGAFISIRGCVCVWLGGWVEWLT